MARPRDSDRLDGERLDTGESRSAAGATQRVGTWAGRVLRAWQISPRERRLAAVAAIGLCLTLFLPWYQETVIATGSKTLQSANATLTGWGAFSFVEAAVLLIAIGVLVLLFRRAEGRAFHLPGGDGWVITAAGLWAGGLVLWRMFDKQGGTVHGQYATTYGIEWGIFVALAVAAFLAYAGSRIRAAHRPEPALPGEEPQPPHPESRQPSDRPVASPPPVRAEGAFVTARGHHAPPSPGPEDTTAPIRRARPRLSVEDPDPTRVRRAEPLPSLDGDASATRVRRARPPLWRNDEDPTERIRRRDQPPSPDDEDVRTRVRRPDQPPNQTDEDVTTRVRRPD